MNYEFQSQRKKERYPFWLSGIFCCSSGMCFQKASTLSPSRGLFLDKLMVIETFRPFDWRDLRNGTVEQGALAVVEQALTHSRKSRDFPARNCDYSGPTIDRPFRTYHLPTLAIFEEACLALVHSTIFYCILLVSPCVLRAFPMCFAFDLFFAYLELKAVSPIAALAT